MNFFNDRYYATNITILGISYLICLLIYWPGLYGPLLLDDIANLGLLLDGDVNLNNGTNQLASQLINASGPLGRPISMLTFMINALTSQDLFFWKLTNLVIHIFCGFLIYKLSRILITFIHSEKSPNKSFIPAMVATFWLLHPLQVSTVLYTVQRMTQLSALFVLAGLICYVSARKLQQQSKPYIGLQVLTWLVWFPLGVFSKETALLFPLFILVFELFVIQYNKITNRQLVITTITLAFLALAVFLYKADYFLGGYNVRDFTWQERMLTETRVMVAYLGMLLIPAQKDMGFLHDDFIISKSLFDPWTTAPSIALLVLLVISAFIFRKKQPLYSTGILFFFVGHLLESTIFPLELMYEHRNYLPSFGILLALITVFSNFIQDKNIKIFVTGLTLSILIFTTWLLAETWGSYYLFYYQMESNHPKSERLAAFLSSQAVEAHDYQRARDKLNNFHSLGAKTQLLYIDCLEHKTLTEDRFVFDDHQKQLADNLFVMGIVDIANLGLDNDCKFSYPAYLKWLTKIIDHTTSFGSNRQMLMMYKAHYQWRLEQKEPAISTLQQAFLANPINPTPLFLACEWALDENMKATADELCPKAFSVAEKTPYKFDELSEKVRKRLQSSHPVN